MGRDEILKKKNLNQNVKGTRMGRRESYEDGNGVGPGRGVKRVGLG